VVHDDPGGSLTGNGHPQGLGDELGVLVSRHGPADHLPREDVEDDGEEQEARPGGDVGDVGHPALVGSGGTEVALHEVRGGTGPVVSPGGATELPSRHPLELGLCHKPGHPVPTHVLAVLLDELGGHPPVSVGLSGLFVDEVDLLGEDLVGHRPGRRGPGPPAVVAARGDAQAAAHGGHVEHGPVRLDELEHR